MPAQSDAQRKFLYATKGEAWVKKHHFDTPGHLPAHKKKRKKRTVPRPDKNGRW